MSDRSSELTPTPQGTPAVEDHPTATPHEERRHYSELRNDEDADSVPDPPIRYLQSAPLPLRLLSDF